MVVNVSIVGEGAKNASVQSLQRILQSAHVAQSTDEHTAERPEYWNYTCRLLPPPPNQYTFVPTGCNNTMSCL